MLIGLTGGIACGKTTVARLLAERGAIVIDADQIARDVVAPGTDGLAAVRTAFGDAAIDADGALDRPALGRAVFGDPDARARLEGILHPRIAAESVQRISAALAHDPPLVVYDAALLVETGRADAFRPLVVVTAPVAVQRARLIDRDGLDPDAADARLAAQMPIDEKARYADHLIDNGGTREALAAQVDALWTRLVKP